MHVAKLLLTCMFVLSIVILGCGGSEISEEVQIGTCQENLRTIFNATRQFRESRYSKRVSFTATRLNFLLSFMEGKYATFRCPKDPRPPHYSYDSIKDNLAEYSSYYVRNYKDEDISVPENYIVIYEKAYYHTKDDKPACNVVFANGRIETMDKNAFEALLAKQEDYGPKTTVIGWEGDTPPMPAMP